MNNLLWFTNNLRVEDCASTHQACQGDKVLAVYCFDPRFFQPDPFGFIRTERFRAKFLIQTVSQLRQRLNDLNISLLVYLQRPEDIMPKIVDEHAVNRIFFQREWTRDECAVIDAVGKAIDRKVDFIGSYDQLMLHPDDLPYETFDDIPEVFTRFRKRCEQHCNIRPLTDSITKLPSSNRLDNQTQIPTLQQLGLQQPIVDERSAFDFSGGEMAGLERLDYYLWQSQKITGYKQTRNGLIGKDYSSKLSAWLANGSLSPRTVYHEVKRFEQRVRKNDSTYWLIFELFWRDYFKYIALKHRDRIFQRQGIAAREYPWNNDLDVRSQWIEGRTEKPFINANMRELALTGWMSNRGRQNVASYWSRHLLQDWRIGAAYFESMLIDYDVHSNWGNWMYNSGVGNDPRDRTFNLERQAEVYDKQGRYRDLWLSQEV